MDGEYRGLRAISRAPSRAICCILRERCQQSWTKTVFRTQLVTLRLEIIYDATVEVTSLASSASMVPDDTKSSITLVFAVIWEVYTTSSEKGSRLNLLALLNQLLATTPWPRRPKTMSFEKSFMISQSQRANTTYQDASAVSQLQIVEGFANWFRWEFRLLRKEVGEWRGFQVVDVYRYIWCDNSVWYMPRLACHKQNSDIMWGFWAKATFEDVAVPPVAINLHMQHNVFQDSNNMPFLATLRLPLSYSTTKADSFYFLFSDMMQECFFGGAFSVLCGDQRGRDVIADHHQPHGNRLLETVNIENHSSLRCLVFSCEWMSGSIKPY